jgi:hypothetical protein
MCFDLGADLLHGETGDFASASSTSSYPAQTMDSPQLIGQESSGSFVHECFCCCAHLEQALPTAIQIAIKSSPSIITISTPLPDPDPVYIYHPPQALE